MAADERVNRIEIRGFRGLSHLELDQLGAFNVLLGANDVGKTSVLEASVLVSDLAHLFSPIEVQNLRHLRVADFDDISLLFHKLDGDTPIRLAMYSSGSVERQELNLLVSNDKMEIGTQRIAGNGNGSAQGMGSAERSGDHSSSKVSVDSRILRYHATVKPRGQNPWEISNAIRVTPSGDIQSIEPVNPLDKPTIVGRYLTAAYGYVGDLIGKLIIQKKTKNLVEFLQEINPKIMDISVIGNVAFVDVGLKKMIPLNMFGSGMMRAVTILSLFILGQGQILLIDEVENGLHYTATLSLLKFLLTLSRDQGVQVFVTTHSIGVLESLQQVLGEDAFSEYRKLTNCYTLQRNKDGLVRSYRYGYEQFDHCIRHGIEIR